MRIQNNLVQTATGDTGNAGQPFDYAAAAAEVNKALDTIDAIVPKFLGMQENSPEFVRRRRNVPLTLVQKAIVAAEQNRTVHPLFDIADARASLEFENHFRAIQVRMNAGARDLGLSLDRSLMLLGRVTRQFYVVAKSVVEHLGASESLAEYIESMKAALPQAKRHQSPEKASEKAARDATRAEEKAAKANAKAAAKAAKVKTVGTKATPAAAGVPGPM
jgi:hypothetical protein